jgi:Zn-dependent protease with chaperone function
MRRLAVRIAAMGFFVLAAVGAVSGQPPFDCAWRGLVGAAVLFILVIVGGRLVVSIVVSAVMRQMPRAPSVKDPSRERGN